MKTFIHNLCMSKQKNFNSIPRQFKNKDNERKIRLVQICREYLMHREIHSLFVSMSVSPIFTTKAHESRSLFCIFILSLFFSFVCSLSPSKRAESNLVFRHNVFILLGREKMRWRSFFEKANKRLTTEKKTFFSEHDLDRDNRKWVNYLWCHLSAHPFFSLVQK